MKDTKKGRNKDQLACALDDWRQAEPDAQRLSQPVRERILDAVKGGGETRLNYLAPLFWPFRRVAMAVAVPAMVLAMAVGYLVVPPAGTGEAVPVQATNLDVIRQGEEIVFVIANGQTTHLVYKSTEISDLRAVEPVQVSNGVYRDRIDRQAELVFYRID